MNCIWLLLILACAGNNNRGCSNAPALGNRRSNGNTPANTACDSSCDNACENTCDTIRENTREAGRDNARFPYNTNYPVLNSCDQ